MAHGPHEVLIVEVAGQRFGFPASLVRQLLRAVYITPLPRAAPLVEGVISICGTITPVLDVRQWLGLPAKPVELTDHLVVVHAGPVHAALRVDRALELARVHVADPNREGPEAKKDVDRRHMGQVVQYAGELIVIPDLLPLLAHAESIRQEATSS